MGPTTVTDPLGNVQIHAFTNLGVSFGSNMLVENQVEYRDSSGTPLRRVNTDWATDTGPAISFQTVDTNDSPVQNTGYYLGDNQSRNPRVIRVTTTLLDTNQVSKIETDYADCMSWSGYYSTTYTDCPSNPTQIREYDYGTGSAGSLLRYTNLTYLHGTSGSYFNAHMLDRVATKSIYTGGGALFAQTTYGYDTTMITGTSSVPYHDYTNYSSGNTVRGNVTTVTNLLNPGNTSLTTYNYYNDVGNLVKIIDPGTHATQFSYADNFTDAANRNSQGYVTSVAYPTTSNGVPHADGKQYFWYTGAVAAVCGENAPSPSACVNTYIPSPPTTIYADYTKYTYDMLGRPLTVINGDGGTSSVTFSDLTSTSTPITVGSSSAIDSSHNLVNTAVLDGFGRTAHTQLNSDPCGTDLTDTTYDAVDRKSTVSNPYRTSDSCSAGTSTNGTSTYQYDALGRLVKVIPPDGSSSANNVTTTYSGNCTTVTDQAGKARKSCSDGLGRLIKAFESPSSLNYETDYVYDVLNNLTQVVQKGGTSDTSQWRTRTFAYDSLSRLTSASNPESGTVSYTYDSDGNMLTKTDARSTVTTMAYDELHRVLTKSYSGGTAAATPIATYIYDVAATDGPGSSANPIGRLVEVKNSNATEVDSYDTRGRVSAQWQCTPLNCGGSWFNLTYAYNFAGGLISESTPMGFALTPSYDSAAHLTQLSSSWSDTQHPATLATITGFTPAGSISQMTYGNGVLENSTYNNRLQPVELYTHYFTGYGSNQEPTDIPLLDLRYGYADGNGNNNGNVVTFGSYATQIFMRTYTYDALNRLATMSSPSDASGCYGLTWTYDAWGNRTAQTTTPATGGSCLSPNHAISAANRIIDTGYAHDSAGNMTGDNIHTYTFDAENHIVIVDTSTATYVYDANGNRVRKSANGVTTDYIYDASGSVVAEKSGKVWKKGYVYAGGQLVAQYNGALGAFGATTLFVHKDHLGSTRMLTAVDGSVSDSMDYLPYGELLAGGSGSTHEFTGKERDAESGLDDFSARYYASNSGRFQSADPLTATPARLVDPQQLNLYSYVRNNPLILVDPTGMIIDYSHLSEKDQKEWLAIEAAANIVDHLGEYVYPMLHAELVWLESDARTYVIADEQMGQQDIGQFTITKFKGENDFSEAKIALDFKKIKDRETSSPGDFDSSFNKLEGLFEQKNAPLLRLAEMFGHEGAHALYAMVNPSDAVQIQRLLNDRDAAIHSNKVKYPYPPDVLKKMEAAHDALIPTESFAQMIEKIINGELRAGKVKK